MYLIWAGGKIWQPSVHENLYKTVFYCPDDLYTTSPYFHN